MRTFLSVLIVLLLAATTMGADASFTWSSGRIVDHSTNSMMRGNIFEGAGIWVDTVVVTYGATEIYVDSVKYPIESLSLAGYTKVYVYVKPVTFVTGDSLAGDDADAGDSIAVTCEMSYGYPMGDPNRTIDWVDLGDPETDTIPISHGDSTTVTYWVVDLSSLSNDAGFGVSLRLGLHYSLRMQGESGTPKTDIIRYMYGFKLWRD